MFYRWLCGHKQCLWHVCMSLTRELPGAWCTPAPGCSTNTQTRRTGPRRQEACPDTADRLEVEKETGHLSKWPMNLTIIKLVYVRKRVCQYVLHKSGTELTYRDYSTTRTKLETLMILTGRICLHKIIACVTGSVIEHQEVIKLSNITIRW